MVNDIDEIYVQITADIRNLEAGLSQANKRIGEFGKKTDDSNKQTISSFNDLGKSAKLVAAAIRVAYTVVAASAITNFVKDAVNAFDKYEGSIKALNNISGDQADAIVKNMDVMAQGLVSSSQLVKDANKALMAEFTPTQAVELMKTASASAAIMSNDISNTYGQLIDSIIQGRDKVLKTQLGITVDFQKAFSEYENSVGLAAGSLDDATKQQIAFNLIMAETPGLVEKAKGVVDEYDKSVARTARSWEDAKKTIGEAFQPAMTNVLDTLSRAMITMQNLDLAFESWVYSIRNFIEDKTGWFSITGQKELLDITPEQKKRSADIALKLGEITPAEYEKMYPAEKINDDLVEQLRLNEKISDVTTQIKTREVQIYREGLEPQAKKIYDINTFYDYQITQLLALGATQEQIKSVEDARTAELKAQNSELDKQIQKMIKLTSFSMSGGSERGRNIVGNAQLQLAGRSYSDDEEGKKQYDRDLNTVLGGGTLSPQSSVDREMAQNDFVFRPGHSPVPFSPNDTIIGFKGGGMGGGVSVYIQNLYGMDVDKVGRAFERILSNKMVI